MRKSLWLFLVLSLIDCGQETVAVPSSCPDGSALTYSNFGAALIQSNCLSCHSGKERPSLTTQAAVKANASEIIKESVSSTRMPEGSSLSASERAQLAEWLTCGAP